MANSWCWWLTFLLCACSVESDKFTIQTPTVILERVAFTATLHLPHLVNGSVYPADVQYILRNEYDQSVISHGSYHSLDQHGNFQSELDIPLKNLTLSNAGYVSVTALVYDLQSNASYKTTQKLFVTPGLLSLFPPIITLALSALVGNVMVALLFGIWCGATIVNHGNLVAGLFRIFDQYWVGAFVEDGHAGVLLFTIMLGGTIGIVQKGGGGQGLAQRALTYMTNRLRMQLCSWILCLCIFFDDYSCILIVGNSLRSVLKQTGVSRQKFAVIIHTIGVCLPSMAPVSSWIGVEIGYIAAQLTDLKLDWDPFVTCLRSISYRFFPVIFIAFIFILIIFERDFGPMVEYEKQAILDKAQHDRQELMDVAINYTDPKERKSSISTGPLDPPPGTPLRWINAAVPFLVIVCVTFVGMIFDGFAAMEALPAHGRPARTVMNALSHSDSVKALIRSSATGCIVALTMVLVQKILTLAEGMEAWTQGVKDIIEPTIVLILAWALGRVIGDTQAAPYLASIVHDGLPAAALPAITALLCYIVSFATGSGFGTMAIMFPIISPLAFKISNGDETNLLECFGAILGASTFGNTCSPIADTSILSSLAASIPLTSHIETILPYSLVVGLVALAAGTLPVGFGIYSAFTALGVSFALLIVILFSFGTQVEQNYRDRFNSSFLSDTPDSAHLNETHSLLPIRDDL